MRLVQTLRTTNQNLVTTLAVSPNGQFLAYGQQGDYEGNVNLTLWDLQDHSLMEELVHIKFEYLRAVCFSPDSQILLFAPDNQGIQIYNILSHERSSLRTFDVRQLQAAVYQHRVIATSSITEVWDLAKMERIWLLSDYVASDTRPHAVGGISPDGNQVAILGKATDEVLIYDLGSGDLFKQLPGGPTRGHMVFFSANLKHLAAVGAGGTGAFLWKLDTQEPYLTDEFNSSSVEYRALCFDPSGEYLVAGTDSGYLLMFRLQDGTEIFCQDIDIDICTVNYTHQGNEIIVGLGDGTVQIWDLS